MAPSSSLPHTRAIVRTPLTLIPEAQPWVPSMRPPGTSPLLQTTPPPAAFGPYRHGKPPSTNLLLRTAMVAPSLL